MSDEEKSRSYDSSATSSNKPHGASKSDPDYPLEKPNLGERSKKLYCLCQKEYKDGIIMIQCEGPCQDWYHPGCLNISEDETNVLSLSKEPWFCTFCASSTMKGS